MRKLRRVLALAAALCLLGTAAAEGLQDCHRFTLTKKDTTQSNKSVVRVWTVDTALDSVDAEINALAQDLAERWGGALKPAANKTGKNSRLDVEIRCSRTGLSWMSFLVQARITYHRDLTGQKIVSRTYNMRTGERVMLTDIFAPDSEGWQVLEQAVRDTCAASFPDEEAPEEALEALCTREALESADFTLHGMSLVVHIPADRLYPDHHTLIEVTLYYPQIRPMMTEEAQTETDNASYYKTCALTFDDGPARTNTTLVLQSLMAAGCRATFFVIGNRIASYEDLVQREHDEGHSVGTHNWNHGNVSKKSAAHIRAMKPRCTQAMIAAIGIPEPYNRVPYGLYNQLISAKAGWPLIQWSLDTYDWRGHSTSTILSKVKKEIADGDIILCHDIKDKTPATTTALCEYLQEAGYMLLTVDELFAKDGIELKPDTVYFHNAGGETGLKK